MTREPATPEDAGQAADLAEGDRAASADGLPLPPPDDAETQLARDAGESEDPAKDDPAREEEVEEPDLAAEILSERGAD